MIRIIPYYSCLYYYLYCGFEIIVIIIISITLLEKKFIKIKKLKMYTVHEKYCVKKYVRVTAHRSTHFRASKGKKHI